MLQLDRSRAFELRVQFTVNNSDCVLVQFLTIVKSVRSV